MKKSTTVLILKKELFNKLIDDARGLNLILKSDQVNKFENKIITSWLFPDTSSKLEHLALNNEYWYLRHWVDLLSLHDFYFRCKAKSNIERGRLSVHPWIVKDDDKNFRQIKWEDAGSPLNINKLKLFV